MIFDGIAEIFRGKKPEAPVTPTPQVDIQTLKQDEANLNTVITQGGKDFQNPADANRLREIRNQIAEKESQQAPTPLIQPEVSQPEAQPTVVGPQILNQAPQEVAAPTPIQTPEETKAA